MNNKDKKIEEMLTRYKLPDAPADLKARIFTQKKKKLSRNILATAAAILIVASLTITWQIKPKNELISLDQAIFSIEQHAQASQLLAIADIFASQASGQAHAKELYCEIIESFPELDVAQKAKSKLKSY
jgi:hypothetical protein